MAGAGPWSADHQVLALAVSNSQSANLHSLFAFEPSLMIECQFPDTPKKYALLMRREFGRKTLNYVFKNAVPPGLEGRIRENSLYFPGYQGIWL